MYPVIMVQNFAKKTKQNSQQTTSLMFVLASFTSQLTFKNQTVALG